MRVVSLCPSLTELVCDLGAHRALVGRTRYCVVPAEKLEAVPVVGGTKNPRVDEILVRRPDLVLMNQEENRRDDAETLRAAGLSCLVLYPRTVEETAEMVRRVGEALERVAKGREIAAEIESELAAARRFASRQGSQRWAYLIWRKPWMAVGGDTYIHHLLSAAGGDNVFRDRPERYPAISAEELSAADPDRVLLSSEPFPFADEHRRELADRTGLPMDRFALVDGRDLSWHGSRTPRGLRTARAVFSSAAPEAGRARCS